MQGSMFKVRVTFTLTEWSFDVRNEPKNSLASTVFNDIELLNVSIEYAWDAGVPGPTGPRVIGLGNTTIAVASQASVTFTPITFDDLSAAVAGRSATLTLTFNAQTIEGNPLSKTVTRTLNIEPCIS